MAIAWVLAIKVKVAPMLGHKIAASGIVMTSVILIALIQSATAPAATPPVLRNPDRVITAADFPRAAMRQNAYGIVSSAIHIASNGRILGCEITETSGSSILDDASCSLIKSRARFDPALDANGTPIAGQYRLANVWGLDENQPHASISITLHVITPFEGYRRPTVARLAFGPSGRVDECTVTKTSGSEAADEFICQSFKREFNIPAPKSGNPAITPVAIRYITARLVEEANSSPQK